MFRKLVMPILLLAFVESAAATVSIRYRLDSLGGQNYQYVYTITNDGSAGGAVLLFDILFNTTLYSEPSLQILTPTNLQAQWSEQILASVPGLPATYDVLSLSGGIPVGGTVSGFVVRFTWLGQGVPGSQPFQIYNPNNFSLLQSGSTSVDATPIPTVSTIGLSALAVGLALATALQTKRQLTGARQM